MERTVAIIGLGRLGAPIAASMAARGLRVIGVDTDLAKVEAMNCGRSPVFEPGMEEMLKAARGRLSATLDTTAASAAAATTFIVVPTPSEPDGGFSLRYVGTACEAIGPALSTRSDRPSVVLTSTVMPGSTGGFVREVLEKTSGKCCGEDFGLCYSPEFVALGTVIRDFLNPDFLLIGESDPRSGEDLAALYAAVCQNKPSVARTNFVNAEVAKLAINTYVTTKISFANMLARICEKLPEADVDEVSRALGMDSRIGGKYLRGAISYGGPCFPRDNLALAALARRVGAPSHIAETTHQFNRFQIEWLADVALSHMPAGGRAGILGLTYKPNTDVVEESVGSLLARELIARRVPVVAYDPAGNQNAAKALGGELRIAETPQECIEQANVVVLATPWPGFREIPAEQWARHSPPRVVIDCWRALKHLSGYDGVRYLGLGTGNGVIQSCLSLDEAIR
jgi:UDPglucose 6-dehydrogenase